MRLREGARFGTADWAIVCLLLSLIAFELPQILGLVTFSFGLGPPLLVSLFLLGGILWLASPSGRAIFRLGKVEVAILGIAIAVSAAGVLGMLNGIAFAGVVALGYLVVAAAAFGVYRMDAVRQLPEAARAPLMQPAAATGGSVRPARLRQIDIFQDFSSSELEAVAALAQSILVPRGTAMTTAAEPAAALYAIFDGQAELHARSPLGDLTVRVAGTGESFPLAALVGSGQVITSARAMTDMEVVVIPVVPLRDLCVVQPEMGRRLYAQVASILAERYRATLNRLTRSMEDALRTADFWANL